VAAGTSLALFVAVAAIVVAVYASIIPLEEAYLVQTFGAAYESYRREVPAVVPRVVPLEREARQGRWSWAPIAKAEIITLIYFAAMVAAVILKGWTAK
jgi:ABC-type transport system involved in cytochrome c biogenesis permease subunit